MVAAPSDFVSAALRHIRDAEHLAASGEHTSLDQAWHLAGFAHECARKSLIRAGWVPRILGHDFTKADEHIVDIAIALEPSSGRLPLPAWAARFPAVGRWRPDHRYERTGAVAAAQDRDIGALVSQAREGVDHSVAALFIEGTIQIESVR
jgi:hypothetical protein